MARYAYPLARSPRSQVGLALGLSLWLYLFLSLIGPFDAAELSLPIRIILMTGYGLVFFCCYLASYLAQILLIRKSLRWTVWQEIQFTAIFLGLGFPATYLYYISGWMNGDWPFPIFTTQIFLPTLAIILPVLLIGRYLLGRQEQKELDLNPSSKSITIVGDSRLDHLNLHAEELIAISAAGNYCTIFFRVGNKHEKRLLRISLSKAHEQVPQLIKIHRSHLINPQHFIAWIDEKTILVGQNKLPVSTKYKNTLSEIGLFVPKRS
ncbi:MAG: LytTR family DNA-binding domain-containing protein [Bacteroidota bacterium]